MTSLFFYWLNKSAFTCFKITAEINDSHRKWPMLHYCFINAAPGLLGGDLTTSSNKCRRNILPPWPRGQSTRFSTELEHFLSMYDSQRLNHQSIPAIARAAVRSWVAAVERYPDNTLVIELTLLLTCWHTSCLHPALPHNPLRRTPGQSWQHLPSASRAAPPPRPPRRHLACFNTDLWPLALKIS